MYMALRRESGPRPPDMSAPPVSLPGMGRSLRLARQQAYLTVDEAAARAGLTAGEIEALESGTADRLRDRVETLRSLRAYADSVGLLGADYVAALLDLWPPPDRLGARLLDSGPVPL